VSRQKEREIRNGLSILLAAWLALAVAAPAYADVPNGGSPSEGGGTSGDDDEEDDGGCSVTGVAPLAAATSGVALVGLVLAGGVRRRTKRR
jgi:MYXO-CTERM domain-containing protein